MKKIVIILATIFVTACGKKNASFTEVNAPQPCTIVEDTMLCPDGTEYVLPDPEDYPVVNLPPITVEEEIIVVITVPADEEEPVAICEKDNRNGKKCRKVKK